MSKGRPVRSASARPHLAPDQRAILMRLIGDRPDASDPMIAWDFRDLTGRPISRASVGRARRAGYQSRPGNGHLSAAEREALSFLVSEDSPKDRSSCRQVAGRLAAMTGRRVSPSTVWNFRRRSGC